MSMVFLSFISSLRGALLSAEARPWTKADATKQSSLLRSYGLLRLRSQ
jgi:hypothetical protein